MFSKTSTTTKSTTVREIVILARFAIEATGSVVYRIRNGGNKEYLVTLNVNGSAGCVEQKTGQECKGHLYAHCAGHECYHILTCQASEDARMSAIDEAEYLQWKRDMGLDQQMSEQEIERIARYELAYVA